MNDRSRSPAPLADNVTLQIFHIDDLLPPPVASNRARSPSLLDLLYTYSSVSNCLDCLANFMSDNTTITHEAFHTFFSALRDLNDNLNAFEDHYHVLCQRQQHGLLAHYNVATVSEELRATVDTYIARCSMERDLVQLCRKEISHGLEFLVLMVEFPVDASPV